jgi:HEAT repeat protein
LELADEDTVPETVIEYRSKNDALIKSPLKEEVDDYVRSKQELYLPHVPEYLEGLKSDNPDTRALYVQFLARAGDPRAVEPLIDLIRNDPSKMVRAEAINAISVFKDDRAVPILREVIEGSFKRKEMGFVLTTCDALIVLGCGDDCIPFPASIFLKKDFNYWIVDLSERTDWSVEEKEKETEYSKTHYPGWAWIRLKKIDSAKVKEVFRSALSNEDEWIRNYAEKGLQELAKESRKSK